MSYDCDIGAGMYHKTPLVAAQSHIPFCYQKECMDLIMLQEGHDYDSNTPIVKVDPDGVLYKPYEAGDGWANGAVLTCSVDATDWDGPCERYAVTAAKAVVMESINWPAEAKTEEEMELIRGTSDCCWTWRPMPKPVTTHPCPIVKETEVQEGK